jgi:hypothetical protein
MKCRMPGVCGGRGRCGTCRVATLSGEENVPAPGEVEQAILKRIGSAPNGRADGALTERRFTPRRGWLCLFVRQGRRKNY